jgi:hypothetical protein
MTTAYKVLGQTAPTAVTATTLYTVPAVTSTVISTLTACNQGASSATYRVAVRPAGAALAQQHFIVYDAALTGNSTDTITIGVTLATTDVLTVYSSTGTFSFSAFGSELS